MFGKSHARALAVMLVVAGLAVWAIAADKAPTFASQRDALMKAFNAGNWKDAYEGLRKLSLDPQAEPTEVGKLLETGVLCLQRLGRSDEIDEFREAIIAVHKGNWRLLEAAATSYANPQIEHYGYIVAGKFYRGHHRGGGKIVNTWQRDRVRALQLMEQAQAQTARETDKGALGSFYLHFAGMFLTGAGAHEPWRLQYLTDLGTLPGHQYPSS
jgi:hypothetical protein